MIKKTGGRNANSIASTTIWPSSDVLLSVAIPSPEDFVGRACRG